MIHFMIHVLKRCVLSLYSSKNARYSGYVSVMLNFGDAVQLLRLNIYNGNIFPSLNPAKIFQFISRWTESTKSSAVGPNHRAVINTSNEVKSPLLWEFWIYNFSLRILERVLRWKHCKYKEWVSFFLGSWGMNRSAEQTNRPRTASRFTRFVCPVLRFIPHEPRKKDTHSLNIPNKCLLQLHYKHVVTCEKDV